MRILLIMSAKKQNSGNLQFKRSNYSIQTDDKNDSLPQQVFSHVLQIVVPGNVRVLRDINEITKDQPYYCVKNLKPVLLLVPQFIQAFIKRGSLHILSHGLNIESSSCLALCPNGKLILHVTKDDYEVLGLEGTPSKFGNNKYVIEIDLLSPKFLPGNGFYDRVYRCFTENKRLSFNCLLAWDTHDHEISPVSLQVYFEDRGCEVIGCKLDVEEEPLKNIKCPKFSYNDSSEENYRSFWEWLGTTACGIKWGRDADDWLSDIGHGQEAATLSSCNFYSITGFLTTQTVQRLHLTLRMSTAMEPIEWSCLINHGFQDSPVSFPNHEHSYDINGDNITAIVNFKNNNYWQYISLGKSDTLR